LRDEVGDLEEARNRFEDFQHVFLATVEGDQPRVRPVTLIYLDKEFWITTDTWSAKVKQIQENPKVEFSLPFKEGNKDCCIRVAGLAGIIKDEKTRAKLARHCDFFDKHWKSVDDPDYTLLKIRPVEIAIVKPDKTTHMKI